MRFVLQDLNHLIAVRPKPDCMSADQNLARVSITLMKKNVLFKFSAGPENRIDFRNGCLEDGLKLIVGEHKPAVANKQIAELNEARGKVLALIDKHVVIRRRY